MKIEYANWPAPKHIVAGSTTRHQGFSLPPYDSNNFGFHVGDNPVAVEQNRQQFKGLLSLTNEPIWLNQTHSTHCINADKDTERDADAAITKEYNKPLVILTADCLPIMLCAVKDNEVAAIHAGWKGLCNGIIENTLKKMTSLPNELMAWIGPSICQKCYEVGEEVYLSFINQHPEAHIAFTPSSMSSENNLKYLANLPLLAELLLKKLGVSSVHQSNLCTFELKKDFYSYRRTKQTGRIATFIWITGQTL